MNRLIPMLLAVVVFAAACGDDDSRGTTITVPGGVVFGEGEIPDGIPDDFPIPPSSVIGSYLIDGINHRSEVSLTVNANIELTIRFFSVGLVNEGYVVESSEGSAGSWSIEFSRGELAGTILITAHGETAQAAIAVNQA